MSYILVFTMCFGHPAWYVGYDYTRQELMIVDRLDKQSLSFFARISKLDPKVIHIPFTGECA